MKSQLSNSLQKTSFWMLMVAIITGLFNAACCGIVIHHYSDFGYGRSLVKNIEFVFIFLLIIASFSSVNAFSAFYFIRKCIKEQDPLYIQKAFVQESKYWTKLMLLTIITTSIIILDYYRLI